MILNFILIGLVGLWSIFGLMFSEYIDKAVTGAKMPYMGNTKQRIFIAFACGPILWVALLLLAAGERAGKIFRAIGRKLE